MLKEMQVEMHKSKRRQLLNMIAYNCVVDRNRDAFMDPGRAAALACAIDKLSISGCD